MKGTQRHIDRLQRLAAAGGASAKKALIVAADAIRVEAAVSITKGAISGPGHIPSLPGEPPNADTHQLDTSIVSRLTGPTTAEVSANTPYAAGLEFGTSRVAARPYMRPAAKKEGRGLVAAVRAAAKRDVAGS